MAEKKMLIQYIRRGWKGKRIVRDGAVFTQQNRGPRIGVFVALDSEKIGWSLVHTKGENREPPKNVSWKKGIEIAVSRAQAGAEIKIPGSIRKEYFLFMQKARGYFNDAEAK
jgi:hypothetical protein